MDPKLEEIRSGDTTWRFDREFLLSNWTCIWGQGCQGILPVRAEALGHGCCSIGAELDEGDEARTIGALAATLTTEQLHHHQEAAEGGIYSDAARNHTRVVDGACIFLNPPGFPGGAGCALHLAAVAAGEPVTDWKPSVCWQLPIHVDWTPGPGDTEVATVGRWTRADWGTDGESMAWCCTEEPEAYVGDGPVVVTLQAELEALVGSEVYVELRTRLALSSTEGE